jgi:adenylate cyclase
MNKRTWRMLVGAALIAVLTGHAAGWLALPLLPRLEAWLYDARVRATAPTPVDPRIVIVDIDEKSLREKDQGGEGRWPWRRDRLAQLVTDLFDTYGVSLVALDIILSERDEGSDLEVLERLAHEDLKAQPGLAQALARLRSSASPDQQLAQALTKGPVVLGYAFHNDQPAAHTRLPPGLSAQDLGLAALPAQSYPGYAGLLPTLQSQAVAAGHLNPLRDADGITRRVPLLVEHGGRYYPALSLAVLQAVAGEPVLNAVTARYGESDLRVEHLRAGPITVPVDGALNALVPFRATARSFHYVSAVDVLQRRVAVDALKGRIVLVGTSAAGLADLVATPVGASFPGVEIHANLITGMLDGRIAHAPAYAPGTQVALVLALGLLMLWVGDRLRPAPALAVFALAGLATVGLNLALLTQWQLMLPLAAPLACLASLFVFQTSFGFLVESRGKRQIAALFAHYVPPELVDRMAQDPASFTMAPQERKLTVLFADVRDFTSISERLSPQDLADLINAYLTTMSEVIRQQHQGTLDKYIGDAVMAFWGAPVDTPNHARDAVRAACDMQRALAGLNATCRARGWPMLRVGIGVNTGRMRVGDMGSKLRRAYTVMGDAVNLASRLEGLTKAYGVEILIGQDTRDALDGWTCREVDRVRVKGKDQAVAIFEPLGPSDDIDPEQQAQLAQWHQVLAAYRSRDWTRALDLLAPLTQVCPERLLYAVYDQRLRAFRDSPPPADWDGTTRVGV